MILTGSDIQVNMKFEVGLHTMNIDLRSDGCADGIGALRFGFANFYLG